MTILFYALLAIVVLLLILIGVLIISRGAIASDFSGEWADAKPRNLFDGYDK